MAYKVAFSKSAHKELSRLPKNIYLKVEVSVDGLIENPRPSGCKKLVGSKNTYRIRVADYRIIYDVNDDIIEILIIKIEHRKDVYK
jgi:mRNA interferase RelE/StbE